MSSRTKWNIDDTMAAVVNATANHSRYLVSNLHADDSDTNTNPKPDP